jgi:hypothetical protein
VNVLADRVAPEDLAHRLVEVDVGVWHREAHHLHRLAQPGEVLLQTEGVELPLGLVPVGPQPLEDVRPVEHGGAVDGQHRRGLVHERAVHPDLEIAHRAGSFVGVMTDVTHRILPSSGTLDKGSRKGRIFPAWRTTR